MIGQFFILSPRGDTIINKDFRGDSDPNLQEIFFRKVSFFISFLYLFSSSFLEIGEVLGKK